MSFLLDILPIIIIPKILRQNLRHLQTHQINKFLNFSTTPWKQQSFIFDPLKLDSLWYQPFYQILNQFDPHIVHPQ
ncbi:unnamed protein product [Paramecium octaurelia]|uniref:Uncharacterized protein n=1 Tax=Paramecium octaurelia TaxID=43137 RepID=A0A8S1THJ8_PAROT|nr:unnamed protein product [Paramecium octaurelia]